MRRQLIHLPDCDEYNIRYDKLANDEHVFFTVRYRLKDNPDKDKVRIITLVDTLYLDAFDPSEFHYIDGRIGDPIPPEFINRITYRQVIQDWMTFPAPSDVGLTCCRIDDFFECAEDRDEIQDLYDDSVRPVARCCYPENVIPVWWPKEVFETEAAPPQEKKRKTRKARTRT